MVPKPSSLCTPCAAAWTAREKYDQQDTMFDFMMGLRSDFEPIRVQLLGRPILPTLSETLSALMAEETRLKSLAAHSMVSQQHSVLAVPPLPVEGEVAAATFSKKKIPCSHCGRTNHPDSRCFKKYPHLLAEMRDKRAASRRGSHAAPSSTPEPSLQFPASAAMPQFVQQPVPQYQLFPQHLVPPHSAVSAPQFQQQTSSTMPSSVSQSGTPFWVLDSDASFHMTSNSSVLDSCRPISESRPVQTADGPAHPSSSWYWPSP
ncbi:unnamed protein product [Urochloa humidicola]